MCARLSANACGLRARTLRRAFAGAARLRYSPVKYAGAGLRRALSLGLVLCPPGANQGARRDAAMQPARWRAKPRRRARSTRADPSRRQSDAVQPPLRTNYGEL